MLDGDGIFFEYLWKEVSPLDEASSSRGKIVSIPNPLTLLENPDSKWGEVHALRLSPDKSLSLGFMETVWLYLPSIRDSLAKKSEGDASPVRYKCRCQPTIEGVTWKPSSIVSPRDFTKDARPSTPNLTTGTLFVDKDDLFAWDNGKVQTILRAFEQFVGFDADPRQVLQEGEIANLLQGDWQIDSGPIYLLVDPYSGYFLSDMRARNLNLSFDRSKLWPILYFAKSNLEGFSSLREVLEYINSYPQRPWYAFPYWGKAIDEIGTPRARLCLSPIEPDPRGEWLDLVYPGIRDLHATLYNPDEVVFARSRTVDPSTAYLLATDTCSAMLAQLVRATIQDFNSYAPPTPNTVFDWLHRIAGISTRGLARGRTPNYELHSFFRDGGLFGANTWAAQISL